jgi:DHA2 family multidrug resistance protein
MTTWSLEMGSTPFIVAGLVQGLGMGLIFMPLNGMAFATLPAHQRTEAASLTNLSRNIGASIGISLVTTILARSSQVAHADLAPHITAERLQTLDPALLGNVSNQTDMLLALANAEVTRQAAMIAYLNDFKAMMIVTAASIPLVLFLKRPRAPVRNDPAAAGH